MMTEISVLSVYGGGEPALVGALDALGFGAGLVWYPSHRLATERRRESMNIHHLLTTYGY